MATPRNGWERWRGTVDEKLETVTAGIERIEAAMQIFTVQSSTGLAAHQQHDNERFDNLEVRWTALKTKIALISGGAGILAAALANAAMRNLFGS